MHNNIFLISDASYSCHTQIAGLGVVDLYSDKRYSYSLKNIPNASVAEYRALLLSVQIALKKGYQNVVFIYDNNTLDIASIERWLKGRILAYQFLWLKRDFVKNADYIAKRARALKEKLITNSFYTQMNINKTQGDLRGEKFMIAIKAKPVDAIVKLCGVIGSDSDRILLYRYTYNLKALPCEMDAKSINLFMLVHRLLPKERKKNFYLYIKNRATNKSILKKFVTNKQNHFFYDVLNQIVVIHQNSSCK